MDYKEKLLHTKIGFLCKLRLIFRDNNHCGEDKYEAIRKLDLKYAKIDKTILEQG